MTEGDADIFLCTGYNGETFQWGDEIFITGHVLGQVADAVFLGEPTEFKVEVSIRDAQGVIVALASNTDILDPSDIKLVIQDVKHTATYPNLLYTLYVTGYMRDAASTQWGAPIDEDFMAAVTD